MPAFTFEKISPPVSTEAPLLPRTAAAKASRATTARGILFQMLDRFALARLKRDADTTAPPKRPPPD